MSDDTVVDFPLKSTGEETPDRLLGSFNKDKDTRHVVIIGIDDEGSISISKTYDNWIEVIGLLEVIKQQLISSEFTED